MSGCVRPSASSSSEGDNLALLIGVGLGLAASHLFGSSAPSCSSCPKPSASSFSSATTVRVPITSSTSASVPVTSMSSASNSAMTADAQNIRALQTLLLAQQQQALKATYLGVGLGVLAVAAGVALCLIPKVLKNRRKEAKKKAAKGTALPLAPPLQQQQPQQGQVQYIAVPSAPSQSSAPATAGAVYPTASYSL